MFSTLNNSCIGNVEASNINKAQEDLSPLITYTTEQIGDREKMIVTVSVEDRSGTGIKEFRDYNNNLINGDSYTFEINRRGNYTFSAIDNNDKTANLKIEDSWVNPIISEVNGRVTRGSGYWSSSNLREWLNSDKEHVNYTCNPPSEEFMGDKNYENEPGFLYEFTDDEKNAILVSERLVFLASLDSKIREGGRLNPPHVGTKGDSFLATMSSYAFDNYKNINYKRELDKVFLLSPHELYQYVFQRGFSTQKELTSEAKIKNNLSSATTLWWLQYSSTWIDCEWTGFVGNNSNSLLGCGYADSNAGVVPAIHLNGDYVLSNNQKVSEHNIGDTVVFGRYLNSPIAWEIINKTDNNDVLLLSKKILDVKQMDANGDQSRLYSDYINYYVSDVNTVDNLQFKSTFELDDVDIPTVNILNNEELNERKNSGYTLDFLIEDTDSGINYVILPDGSKIFSNSFSYVVTENKDYIFKAMDNAGNQLAFLTPVYNINQEPEINISISDRNWSNSNVFVDIATSDKVIYRLNSFKISNMDGRAHSHLLPNYTSYNGCTFNISGKAKLNFLDDKYQDATIGFGGVFDTKSLTDYGYRIGTSHDKPLKLSMNDLSFDYYTDFEFNYDIPLNYSHNLKAYFESYISNSLGKKVFEVELKDLKFELLNDSTDFRVESIVLPTGEIVNEKFYTDIISKEGINNFTYKVLDSRGKETVRTVTTKIDKTAPTLNLDYDKSTELTTQNILVSINASDSLSGFKRIKLPDGNYITNSNSTYTISSDGSYTFESEDVAGNITTKTITINNIDKEKPNVSIDKNDNWTNKPVQININTRD